MSFLKFDIADFYPSITEDLLRKAVEFARRHTNISNEEREIIWHARKSLLFGNDAIWSKRANSQFDVTMGSYDGAEICELVGLYILDLLSQQFDKQQLGLYRDDGATAINLPGPEIERAKTAIRETFEKCNLRVIIENDVKRMDFLDVTMDLTTGKYWPYRKPNSELRYINVRSNHPPTIIKQLPKSITSKIASLSSNAEEYEKALPAYKEALE